MARYVPAAIDRMDADAINSLNAIMKRWMEEKTPKAVKSEVRDLFAGVKKKKNKEDTKLIEDRFKADNLELIVWEYISKI